MSARLAAIAAAIVLVSALAPAARAPSVASFPGPIQPDPGTRPAPDRNGRVVAFAASFRENGDRFDPAADPTVLLWDRPSGTLRQITAAGPCDQPAAVHRSGRVRIGDATEKTRVSRTLVAFRSTADHAGRNADGSPEIFVWDSRTNGIAQVTDALAGESSDPALGATFRAERDAAGNRTGNLLVRYRVAFLSTSDLTGDNPAGLRQVFVFDSGFPEVGRLVQVSHSTTGQASPPAVDGRGSRVAFRHDGEVLQGIPGAGEYSWSRAAGLRVSPTTAVSAGTEGPVLDATGRFLATTAHAYDPGSGSPVGTTVAVADLRKGRLHYGAPSSLSASHRSPSLGRGRRVLCLSTDPGDGGPAVPERPVMLRGPRRLRGTGLPAGPYGSLFLQADRRYLFLTSTQDLDGTNASGREVLFRVRPGR